jgi:hypothetical protein
MDFCKHGLLLVKLSSFAEMGLFIKCLEIKSAVTSEEKGDKIQSWAWVAPLPGHYSVCGALVPLDYSQPLSKDVLWFFVFLFVCLF